MSVILLLLAGSAVGQDPLCRFPAECPRTEPTRVGVVAGEGTLEASRGSLAIRVDAVGHVDDADGTIRVADPDGPWFEADVACVRADDELAYVVGRIERGGADGYRQGQFVVLGVRDGFGVAGPDAVVLSTGLPLQPDCRDLDQPAPHWVLVDGSFDVQLRDADARPPAT